MTRRLIFSGTREPLSDQDRATLLTLVQTWAGQVDEIGVGDCRTGVDAQIREWLPEASVFAADWRVGPSAGPQRNARMVLWAADAEDAMLIAMPSRNVVGSRGRGTRGCVDLAIDAGLVVIVAPTGCRPRMLSEANSEIERLRALAQASISAAQRYAMERT